MEDDTILDSQITASNFLDAFIGGHWPPHNGRLNHGTAWSNHVLDLNQWIQVVFNADHFLYGIQTQGYGDAWITSFKVVYSTDGGTTWMSISGADGQPEVKYLLECLAISGSLPRNMGIYDHVALTFRTGVKIYPYHSCYAFYTQIPRNGLFYY